MATKGYVIPHAVGVDISCGMQFSETNIEADRLLEGKPRTGEKIADDIFTRVPVGMNRHNKKQSSLEWRKTSDQIIGEDPSLFDDFPKLKNEFFKVTESLGTLGSGNHFLELQRDTETGKLCIMIHSGSRHFGYAVAKKFDEIAQEKNELWHSQSVPDLAFLPVRSHWGEAYLMWMELAMAFAELNRDVMMSQIQIVLRKYFPEIRFGETIRTVHNYADIENHFGENVWVHRKGAIRAREGQKAIIPGAMGSYSYIVEGRGNSESFCSASHGAGRRMSRTKAKNEFTEEEVREWFVNRDMILSAPGGFGSVLDEFSGAYKSIDDVMDNQKDLVRPVQKLETVCVVKG